jgi:hypothetical protein
VCPKCQASDNHRFIAGTRFFIGASDWDKAEYNPALGCVTRNAQHRRQIARDRGVEEIGNDYGSVDKIHKHFESAKAEELRRSWERV